MIEKLYENLYSPLVEGIGGIGDSGGKKPQPTPITYLTQWKIVGNSEVHTLPYPDGVVLPNGYKRCNYLASDGVAYIELPYGFKVTDNIYIKCAMLELVDWGGVIASKTWESSSNRKFTFGGAVLNNSVRVFSSSFGITGPANGVLSPQVIADTNMHEWTYANYKITIDNYASQTYQQFGESDINTDNLRIFYGYDRPRKYRIYDYRHTKDNTEYHLVPCLDSNDTPCMYDVINNQAYYNSADSGSFTYELYPQPTEIWSCGEYNATDGKYHILVKPQEGSIADIALDEPLRKVNNVADSIEFPSGTEGKALLTIRVEESGGELSPLDTPITELVDAPQIEEAESYTCVISQGGKAVSWSEFLDTLNYLLTDSENNLLVDSENYQLTVQN